MKLLIVYQTPSSDALLIILGFQKLLAVKRMSQHPKVISSKSFIGLTTTTCPMSIVWLSLHKDKIEYISYQHNRHNTLTELPFICKQFQYWVSDTTVLRPTLQLRDLGVTMASGLPWTHDILDITSKARQKAAWVLSLIHYRSPEIMLTLYKSMVRSLLEYCCPLWSRSTPLIRFWPQQLLECLSWTTALGAP